MAARCTGKALAKAALLMAGCKGHHWLKELLWSILLTKVMADFLTENNNGEQQGISCTGCGWCVWFWTVSPSSGGTDWMQWPLFHLWTGQATMEHLACYWLGVPMVVRGPHNEARWSRRGSGVQHSNGEGWMLGSWGEETSQDGAAWRACTLVPLWPCQPMGRGLPGYGRGARRSVRKQGMGVDLRHLVHRVAAGALGWRAPTVR